MALMEAIKAVRDGLTYSTATNPRQPANPMFAGIGGGIGGGGGGGGGAPQMAPGDAPPTPTPTTGSPSLDEAVQRFLDKQLNGGGSPRYTRENPDGSETIYELQGGQAVVVGQIPAPAPPPDPLSGLYPYDPSSGLVSAYPNESPIGSGAVEAGGATNIYADPSAGLLYSKKGSLLPEYLQKALGGFGGGDAGPGGGGGITALQQATLDRQARADEWNQIMDYIAAAANERQLQASLAAARRNALISAAPDLAGGMQYSGGFEPYGGYTLLDLMQGGTGAPRDMASRLTPLDLGPAPADPGLVDRLLGPLMSGG